MSAPPAFLQTFPTETDATDGDIVTFQVKVSSESGDPTTVSWWRCGEPLRPIPGRREMISHEDGWHELILSNVSDEDDGEYECRAENDRGHNSCFGSLYYYQEGAHGTLTDVTLEGTIPEQSDGRQSGLLILIDDGSQTEDSESGQSNRKSMTVSEQMQGIIEDLTQGSSQGEQTGSLTLEKELDEEDQFNSDLEDLDIQNVTDPIREGAKTASADTLVLDMPSPDITGDAAVSEGAPDPFATTRGTGGPQKWSSNPITMDKKRGKQSQKNEGEAVWPPEASMVTFDLPLDTVTTSVELPFATDEDGAKASSMRTAGADTPFDVADITEEAVDVISKDGDGSTRAVGAVSSVAETTLAHVSSSKEQEPSLTSVTEISGEALLQEGCQQSAMSFTRSSFKSSSYRYTDEGVTEEISTRVSTTAAIEEMAVNGSAKTTRIKQAADFEEDSLSSAKRSKLSAAYEADDSSFSTSVRHAEEFLDKKAIFSDSFITETIGEKKGIDVYVAIMDFQPMSSDEEAIVMKEGQEVEIIDASKPRRWLVRTRPMDPNETPMEGWVPACYLEKTTALETLSGFAVGETPLDPKEEEALFNRDAIVKELVETEEDFAKDMQYVVDNYYKQMDNPKLPKVFRDRKGSIFGNFKDISDFHNNVLMKGVYYHAKEPTKLGKTFLRLERDFDMHAAYCWSEARAQQLLKEGQLKEFFDDHSRIIDDEKQLSDHLKLPIQRLNDYQLLLKELIKYCGRLDEDTTDLQKALDFIHSINKRTRDLQVIQSIQGCTGDLLKLGRILNQDVFEVIENKEQKGQERHVFLFKGRVFVTEKQTTAGKESYHVTNLFKLQDVEVVENVGGEPSQIVFRSHKKTRPGFPLVFKAKSPEQKSAWLKEAAVANQGVEDLGEQEPSIERPDDITDNEKTELKHKAEVSVDEPEQKKTKVDEEPPAPAPQRQDSVPKKKKDSKATRQDSAESKSSESSVPQTPTEDGKAPPLSRQDSVKKRSKKAPSTPETPPPPIAEEPKQKKKTSGKQEFDPMDLPRFSKALRGVTCNLGETAVLECETEGGSDTSVTWLKDNQKLVKSNRIKTASVGQKHSLTVKDTTVEDGGLYTVVAANSKGSVSCSAPLNLKLSLLGLPKEDSRPTTPGGTILPHAPVFKVKLNKETQLLEGTSVRFELVVRGNPEPSVKFYKDGKELKQDDRVRVSFESKEVFELILDHVVAKDAGTYSCVAKNSEGEDKTTGILSVVKHKDVFRGLEEYVEEEREPSPRPRTPKFKWFKNGQDFEASERFQVIFNEEEDSLALMFQHVTPDDAGLYTCVASTSTGSKIACSAELTVQGVVRQVEAPGIKAELSDVEATEGGSAMLELKITGYPKPKVTWFHKDKEVSTGGRFRFLFADEESFTLVIKNIKKDDSGRYRVKAVNEVGEAESSCNLSVKSAPSFVKGLKDMSVMAGEVIKFDIQVDGNPAPDVKWYKDGQQLAPGDKIKISGDAGKYSLQISNCKPSDSGSYSCVLTNNLGSQAEFGNVVVKASPTFVKGMEDVSGCEGETLQFTVEVSGVPKPAIKWTKDGKELTVDGKRIKVIEEGTNTYSLVIDKAVLSDVGVYTCELRNEHGLKASSGNLALKTKPEFIKKLSDMEAKEGENLIMNVTLKGFPKPTIKWRLGDSALNDDKLFAITSDKDGGSHSLKIKKITRNNSGVYTCEATNEIGTAVTSGKLTVQVAVKKPGFDQELKATQLVEGKPGKLTAKVSGEPKPTVKWLKDGKPIRPNGHYKIEESDDGTIILLIDNVTPDDAGLYTLEASSDEGKAKSEAPVTTIPPGRKPEFLKELEKLDLIEGQPLNLKAKVTGKPTSIKWQKDGEDLSPSDRIRITEEPDGTVALVIDKASQNDAGKYTVIATNAEGKARSASLVQVQAVTKPEIVSSLAPLTLKDGETGQLKVKVSGEPRPAIKWLKDGRELKPTNRVEAIEEPDGTVALIIKNARPDDAGHYSVVASNPKGEVKSSAPVAVNQAPTFQKPLGPVNVVEGYPAKLEAKLGGSPPPEIKWMKDGEQVIPDGVHIKEIKDPDGTVALVIDKCKPEDAGKYSLKAVNPLGENSSDGPLSVSGTESDSPKCKPCFVSPLGNLSVKEGEPIHIEAEIIGNPLPIINWLVNDKELTPNDNTMMTFDGDKAILEIKHSAPEHIGNYACKLSNPLGEAESKGSVTVQEKTAPRFIQRLNDFNGFIGQPLKLTCKVTGYPDPQIDWYFNGDMISPSNSRFVLSTIGDANTLMIHSCQPGDTGVYECRATNSLGDDHTRSTVNISDKVEKGEPPMFLKKIGDNEVMEGMTAKFTACITGIPTPDVRWVKEGKPLDPSPRHKMELESTGILRLIIREVESADYGDYSVTISNIHGSATSSAKVQPDSLDQKYITPIGDQFVDFDKFKKTGAPVPLPEKPRIVRMSDSSMTLAWKPSVPNVPRVPVTYQLEMATHPDGEWTPVKTGLKDTLCDVNDLRPGSDYKFRIKVENKHGVSEPSPYTIAHRSKIYEPPKPEDFKPKDYSIEHPPLQKYAAPPRFVRKEEDTMYGVRGMPVTIEFWVYGHPEPQVTWFKDDVQLQKDKYGFLQDRNGKLCVFIDCMTDEQVGTYTCVAVNDEGEASMKIKLAIAEPPVFIERLDETTAMSRRSARMRCRVTGLPYPKVKWYRDWHPLYESERIKILWEEPDTCTLFISNLITRDMGLYSCTAKNIAGAATSSASLNVEDSEDAFDAKTYCRPTPVRPRTKMFEDFYDIGDELGRGTQGIIYHAVKRDTGNSYAAKMMHGKGKLKDMMKTEMDIMNQLCHPKLVRLRDAFETKNSLTLLTDICGGGEVLGSILKRGTVSEREIAHYVKQILDGLDYMHSRYVGHLGLTVGDVMISRVNSYDVKFGDFGLAARILPGKDYFLEYGHPEFVAPEIANKQPALLLSDMWSVGVVTYLLLSGISPFLGENDRETLTRVQQGKINFVEDAFAGVSDDAKDFMSKLLVFDPKGRMDVKSALEHRWIKYYSDKPTGSEKPLNNIDRLKDYQKKWKDWYANASCKRYYRRRTLESCFHHPSRMIYPPGESYTPPSSPEPDMGRTHVKPSQFDDITFQQKINREDIDFRSESSYQNGPDTYLLQLRDTDFPLRLRQYLRVGASTSPSLAASLRDRHWGDSTLVIKERRKFVDIMDEEIDDEKEGRTMRTVPMRLYHEIGTLGFAREQMEQLKKEVWKDRGSREIEIGSHPFFREKIRNVTMKEGDEIVFRCYAVGSPKPDYSWFRNDGILLESSRIVVKETKDGYCELRINPTRAYDAAVYKCVTRNMHGVCVCRARLKLGSIPGRPEPPIVKDTSDTEIYITWAAPRDEGQCTTLGYTLEYKQSDAEEWITVSSNVEHGYFVVRNLTPSSFYHFRVKAYNKFGWGQPSFTSEPISTKAEGAEKVKVSPRRKYQQEFTERTPDYELTEIELPELDYNVEKNPIPLIEGDTLDLYRIVSEMDRGRFSVVLNVWVKESNTSSIAKVIQTTEYGDGKQEYEILKSICHERIISLLSASYHADKTVIVMEKLSGVDVMSYLALRHDYNEELVVTIMRQVLDAIEYLHFRDICYLELQPDNVVMVNLRDSDIKLVDFGSARFVPKTGAKVNVKGTPDYLAPEILKNEDVSTLTDVWCVGVLTYILLSGVSPFLGKDDDETTKNVTFVRYHFDNLHKDVTAEATRFLLNIFKACPIKRLTINECLEHKWLAHSEYMIMKRESARFLPEKLAAFAKKFHAAKYEAMNPEMLTSLGMSSSRSEVKVEDF